MGNASGRQLARAAVGVVAVLAQIAQIALAFYYVGLPEHARSRAAKSLGRSTLDPLTRARRMEASAKENQPCIERPSSSLPRVSY
jgi:hypothetical protein